MVTRSKGFTGETTIATESSVASLDATEACTVHFVKVVLFVKQTTL